MSPLWLTGLLLGYPIEKTIVIYLGQARRWMLQAARPFFLLSILCFLCFQKTSQKPAQMSRFDSFSDTTQRKKDFS